MTQQRTASFGLMSVLALLSLSSPANAVTCTTGYIPPGPNSTGQLEYIATASAANACSSGNALGANQLPSPAPGTLLEKLDGAGNFQAVPGTTNGVLTVNYVNQPGTLSNSSNYEGTFSIASGYTNLVLAIVGSAGKDNKDPRYALFFLGSITEGIWSVINGDGGNGFPFNSVSHFALYGTAPSNEVGQAPLPPAVLMFGVGLLGLTVLGRRRKA